MRGLIRNATPKAEPSDHMGCRRTDGSGDTSYLRRPRIRPAEFSSAVAVNHSAALVRQESSHGWGAAPGIAAGQTTLGSDVPAVTSSPQRQARHWACFFFYPAAWVIG